MTNENLNNNKAEDAQKDTTEQRLMLPKYENKPSGCLIVRDEFEKQDLRRLRLILYPGLLLLAAVIDLSFSYMYSSKTFAYKTGMEEKMEIMKSELLSSANCVINTDSYRDDSFLRIMGESKPPLSRAYFSADLLPVSRSYTYLGREIFVRSLVKQDLEKMITDARASGNFLEVNSAYRSFDLQSDWFENNKLNGVDGLAAIPGSSEHQLGTAVDISSHQGEQAKLAGYRWLEDNAHKYGFNLTYPRGREEETGFEYEPWHWRYLGKDLALEYNQREDLFNQGDSLFIENDESVYPYNFYGKYLGIHLYKNKETTKVILDSYIIDNYPIGAIYKAFEKEIDGSGADVNMTLDIRGVDVNLYAKYVEKLDSYLIFIYEDVEGVDYSNDQINSSLAKFCPTL